MPIDLKRIKAKYPMFQDITIKLDAMGRGTCVIAANGGGVKAELKAHSIYVCASGLLAIQQYACIPTIITMDTQEDIEAMLDRLVHRV